MKEELFNQLIEYAADDYEESQKSFILTLIDDAIEEVANAMYPYGFSTDEEEEKIKFQALRRYKGKIRKIAQYHYDKQGKEGVTSFSENSATATYENAGTPESYLRGIIPVAKIL